MTNQQLQGWERKIHSVTSELGIISHSQGYAEGLRWIRRQNILLSEVGGFIKEKKIAFKNHRVKPPTFDSKTFFNALHSEEKFPNEQQILELLH